MRILSDIQPDDAKRIRHFTHDLPWSGGQVFIETNIESFEHIESFELNCSCLTTRCASEKT